LALLVIFQMELHCRHLLHYFNCLKVRKQKLSIKDSLQCKMDETLGRFTVNIFFQFYSIIVHAHLSSFSRNDIFHFPKLKVISNRLPLFSILFPFSSKFTLTGCRCSHSRIFIPANILPSSKRPDIS